MMLSKFDAIFMKGLIGAAVVGIVLSTAGCVSDDMADLRSYVDTVKARPPSKIPPLPVIEPYITFDYQAEFLDDPFLPAPIVDIDNSVLSEDSAEPIICTLVPDIDRPKEELEKYPIDSLKMVGAVMLQGSFFGLVSDKTGAIYRVKEGNYLGKNHGHIEQVEEDYIKLIEIVPDTAGCWSEREQIMYLQE